MRDLISIKELAHSYDGRPTDIILSILKVDQPLLDGIVSDSYSEMDAVAKKAWDCDTCYFLEYQCGWRPEAPQLYGFLLLVNGCQESSWYLLKISGMID